MRNLSHVVSEFRAGFELLQRLVELAPLDGDCATQEVANAVVHDTVLRVQARSLLDVKQRLQRKVL